MKAFITIEKLAQKIRKALHDDLLRELKMLDNKIMVLMNQVTYKNPEDELSILFDIYGSDKSSALKKNVHTYANTYHAIFSPIKDEVKAVFECGISKGASLRAWRDYFKNAVIIGGDIEEWTLFEDVRIHTSLLDQMDPEKISSFFTLLSPKYPSQFDIIIDDGCHIYEATICLFENSLKYLKTNGIYIIEDMLEEYFSKYKEYFKKYENENKITVEYKAMSEINGDPHNNLIIIRKK